MAYVYVLAMNSIDLIRPAVALGALTFLVWVYMYVLRISHMQKHRIDPERLKLAGAESDELLREVDAPSDNLVNLFEVPVLFYTAGCLAIALHYETTLLISIAWLFVLCRVIHSWIHLTNNNVIHRLYAFMAGNACVVTIWVLLIIYHVQRTY